MNKHKIRRTPFDDPKLEEEFRAAFKYHTEVLGLSKRESWRMLSAEYGCSEGTARYWSEPDYRRCTNEMKRKAYLPYSEQSLNRINGRRLQGRIHNDIENNPHFYLSEIFHGSDTFPGSAEPRTLEKICHCLHQGSGIRIRTQSFLKYIQNWEAKYNAPLLEKVPGSQPPLYKFVPTY